MPASTTVSLPQLLYHRPHLCPPPCPPTPTPPGVVHLVGGTAALVASIIIGPRIGRFDGVLTAGSFKGSSPTLYLIGTFLLWCVHATHPKHHIHPAAHTPSPTLYLIGTFLLWCVHATYPKYPLNPLPTYMASCGAYYPPPLYPILPPL